MDRETHPKRETYKSLSRPHNPPPISTNPLITFHCQKSAFLPSAGRSLLYNFNLPAKINPTINSFKMQFSTILVALFATLPLLFQQSPLTRRLPCSTERQMLDVQSRKGHAASQARTRREMNAKTREIRVFVLALIRLVVSVPSL